jgi:hypothetical protein
MRESRTYGSAGALGSNPQGDPAICRRRFNLSRKGLPLIQLQPFAMENQSCWHYPAPQGTSITQPRKGRKSIAGVRKPPDRSAADPSPIGGASRPFCRGQAKLLG